MRTSNFKKRVGHRFARCPALTLAILLSFGLFYLFQPVVGILVSQNDRAALFFTLKPGTEWQIQYMHSVAKVPVREIFVLKDSKEMLLIRTEYSGFGAGLPTESYGSFVHENGSYTNSGLSIPMAKIPLRVGTIANHTLSADGEFHFLVSDYFEPGSLIVIQPIKTFKLRALLLNKGGKHNGF